MSRYSTSATNCGSTHVAFGFLTGLVSFDFGLMTVCHAMHVGALLSAATVLSRAKRNFVWTFGAGLALARIVLLAHWASDVGAGLALGALAERLLRPLTGYGAGAPKSLGPSRPREDHRGIHLNGDLIQCGSCRAVPRPRPRN
jgi:hypothetical protein